MTSVFAPPGSRAYIYARAHLFSPVSGPVIALNLPTYMLTGARAGKRRAGLGPRRVRTTIFCESEGRESDAELDAYPAIASSTGALPSGLNIS